MTQNNADSSSQASRMFPVPPTAYSPTSLMQLGDGFVTSQNLVGGIPAGLTYLGQFVDHDITASEQIDIEGHITKKPGATRKSPILAGTPALDLDVLYGIGLTDQRIPFQTETAKFRLGQTYPDSRSRCNCEADLPRKMVKGRPLAMIPDLRNDENAIISQLHCLFMRFHNRVVDDLQRLEPHLPKEELFGRARIQVTKIYQRIIIDEFLANLCDYRVYEAVIENRATRYSGLMDPYPHQRIDVPREFSGAAFRIGHSMVRENYTLSKLVYSTSDRKCRRVRRLDEVQRSLITGLRSSDVGLLDLFIYSGAGGFRGLPALPHSLVIDWSQLFEINTGISKVTKAAKLDLSIAHTLGNLPVQGGNLAARNLLRQNDLSLPSGQDAVQYLLQKNGDFFGGKLGLKLLDPNAIRAQIQGKAGHCPGKYLSKSDIELFSESTPLWCYVLADSNEPWNTFGPEGVVDSVEGARLGPMGSYIVAETIRSLIVTSRTSIYNSQGDVCFHAEDSVLRDVMKSHKSDASKKFRMKYIWKYLKIKN